MTHRRIGFIVKHVRHGRTEDPAAASVGAREAIPGQRLGPIRIRKIAARRAWSPMYPPEPPGIEHHRVTVIAEWAHLGAAPPGIKCVVAPLDLSDRAHSALL